MTQTTRIVSRALRGSGTLSRPATWAAPSACGRHVSIAVCPVDQIGPASCRETGTHSCLVVFTSTSRTRPATARPAREVPIEASTPATVVSALTPGGARTRALTRPTCPGLPTPLPMASTASTTEWASTALPPTSSTCR